MDDEMPEQNLNETSHLTLLCFIPKENNCSPAYVLQAEKDIIQVRFDLFISGVFIYLVCLASNLVSLIVFSQKKYEGKIVISVLKCFYASNIVLQTLYDLFSIAFYVDVFSLGSALEPVCVAWWFMYRTALTFVSWSLTTVVFLRTIFGVYPLRFNSIRRNRKTFWKIFSGLVFGVLCMNIDALASPGLAYCMFQGRMICRVQTLKLSYLILSIWLPITISFVCTAILLYHNAKAQRAQTRSAGLFPMMNQIAIASTFLSVIALLPEVTFVVYYGSYMDVRCNDDYKLRFILLLFVESTLQLGYSLDCVVYTIVCPAFRKSMAKAWKRFCHPSQPATPFTMNTSGARPNTTQKRSCGPSQQELETSTSNIKQNRSWSTSPEELETSPTSIKQKIISWMPSHHKHETSTTNIKQKRSSTKSEQEVETSTTNIKQKISSTKSQQEVETSTTNIKQKTLSTKSQQEPAQFTFKITEPYPRANEIGDPLYPASESSSE